MFSSAKSFMHLSGNAMPDSYRMAQPIIYRKISLPPLRKDNAPRQLARHGRLQVDQCGGVQHGSAEVLGGEPGMSLQEIFLRRAAAQLTQHVLHGDASAFENRFA